MDTPWKIDRYGMVTDATGEDVSLNGFSAVMAPGPSKDKAKAQTAFVVRAVNSHETLVAALATIASRADGYTHGDDRVQTIFQGIADLAMEALKSDKS